MLRQLGRPLRLDRGHGLKDLLINTHPSSLLSLFFTPFSLFPSLSPAHSLGGIETSEKMERPATSASEKASPLLASSFVLLEGERRLSPFSLSLHLLFCLTHLFFMFFTPVSLLLCDL